MGKRGTKKGILDCYIRVSTTQQKTDGNSLVVQRHLGERVADKLGMEVRWRDEGAQSSTIGYRDVLGELKDDIRHGKVKHLWVENSNRMFRDSLENISFRRMFLEPYKVMMYQGEVPTVLDFSTLSASERMMYDIWGMFQESENQQRSEKSQRGKSYRLRVDGVQKSKPVYLGGTPLFGYKNVDKLWKVDREKSKWVKWIFSSYEKGMSTKEIKDTLDREGVPPARTKSGLWNTTTLQLMLRNKSYTGLHTITETKKIGIDENGKPIREETGTYTYKVPKIITTGQFNRVQRRMDGNRINHSNNKQHFSLLEDILVCECGSHIGSHVKNTTSSLGYKVNTRKYYCVSKNDDWRDGKERNCKNKMSLQMDRTNDYVLNRVKDVVRQSDVLKSKFKSEVIDDVYGKRQDIKETERKLERKLERLQGEMENLENQMVELEVEVGLGKRQRTTVDKIIRRFEEELETRIQEYERTEHEIDSLGEETKWVNWIQRFGEKLELDTSSETKQREFLRGILGKVVVKSENGYGRDKTKKVQRGHSLDFHYRLKIVDDGFRWTDKTTLPWTGKTIEGEKIDKSPMVRMITPRKKKLRK
ncbi:MAG: recombinase family protein [Alphaproteobacteria bacterium]|jgi:DNA invertase Pin-like site-specific DNA recombinase|nr:recombinase family protein [Alphaproteobacteria bacterium]|tara:strand:+ start:808 stop:2574 length:1767 start_codon:yes stop_codon:yes gene_type:complete